jgi:hypothetical protein
LTTGLPHLRLRTAAALALTLLAALLALPGPAQGRKPACTTHGRASHAHCASQGHKARHTHAGKRHHATQGVLVTRPAAPVVPRSAAATGVTCEEGPAPGTAPQGPTSCADGSEPACADGSSAASGACPATSDEDAGGAETACEAAASTCDPAEEDAASQCRDGSSPGPSGEGPGFVCEG